MSIILNLELKITACNIEDEYARISYQVSAVGTTSILDDISHAIH